MIERVEIAGISGWQSFNYTRTIDEPAAAFAVESTAAPAMNTPDTIRQRVITVSANDDLLLTGFVDLYHVEADSETRSRLSISGRSKTSDIIDSQTTGSFRGLNTLQIIQQLIAPYGVEVETTSTNWDIHDAFTVESGSTVMRAIYNVLQLQQKCVSVTATGKLQIYDADNAARAGAVGIGGAIERYGVEYDDTQRFSEFTAKAQDASFFTGPQASEIVGNAFDTSVRTRTRLIYPRGDMTTPRAREAAIRMAKRSLGRGVTVSITVTGWRNSEGRFYEPNQRLFVEIPMENIATELVISSVSLSQSIDSGTTADLELKPIAAFDTVSTPGTRAPSTRVSASSADAGLIPETDATRLPNIEITGPFNFGGS